MGAALKPLLKRLAVGSPAALPTLDLDFLAQFYKVSDGAGGMSSVAFSDLITFTRSSAAWRFNASGVLEQVAANQPRFDYDPVTLALRGLLVEEQRTNLLTYSSQFDNAAWGAADADISVNVAPAPDGSNDSDRMIERTGSVDPRFARNISVASGSLLVLSIFCSEVSGSAKRYLQLNFNGGFSAIPGVIFDVATGVVLASNGGATGFVIEAASGIKRFVLVTPASNASSVSLRIRATANSTQSNITNPASFTGDGASGLMFWGGQLEVGSFPTSYIPTTSAQVTRAADVVSVNTLTPWFNPVAGTIYAEWDASGGLATNSPVWVLQGSGTNIIRQSAEAARPLFDVYADGVAQASISVGAPVVAGVTRKTAATWMLNSFQAAADGSLGAPDVSGSIPSVTQLAFVKANVTAASFNGHIRRIRYWPRRLFDSELQRITA